MKHEVQSRCADEIFDAVKQLQYKSSEYCPELAKTRKLSVHPALVETLKSSLVLTARRNLVCS